MEEDDNGNSMPLKREKNAAELRKSNKPLMEKRRRERINTCLDQLKSLLMEVTKKESSYYSKLEKADILEMTVKYLKNFKRQQLAVAMSTDPSVLGKYVAGYNECTSEVTKYLQSVEGLTSDARTRMLSHLAGCLQRTSTTVTSSNQSTSNLQLTLNQPQPMAIQIPSATPFSALPGTAAGGLCLLNPGTHSLQTVPTSPMQLVPAKLPSGETVYLLANPQTLTVAGNSNINTVAMATIQHSMKPLPLTIPPTFISPNMTSPLASPQSPISPMTPTQVIAPATSTSVDACAEPTPSTSAVSPGVQQQDCESSKEEVTQSSRPDTEQKDDDDDDEDDDDEDDKDEDRINNNNQNEQNRQAENTDRTMWRPW